MRTTLLIIILHFIQQVKGQDSLYAKKIDSLWTESYKPYELIKKRERIREIKFDYNFYKATIKLRSISVWNLSVKPNLFIFFYKADSIVMISPVGQDPYYILNNNLAYAKNLKHSI